jgi:hypothetical protein
MPRRLATVFALLVVCLFAGPAVAADPQKAPRDPQKAPPEISRALLNPYLKVQTALAADDLYTAQAGATEFTVAASAHRASDTNLMMISNRISAAPDLKTARQAFGELSAVLIRWAGKGTGGKTIYIAYCPMVKKSWLQEGEEIANPFYGPAMPRCGEITRRPDPKLR